MIIPTNAEKYPENLAHVEQLLEQRQAPVGAETVVERYATLGQRIGGLFVDQLLLTLIAVVVGVITAFVATDRVDNIRNGCAAASAGYYIYFHWRSGQTVGKAQMESQVVCFSSRGLISFRQSLVRGGIAQLIGISVLLLLFVMGYDWSTDIQFIGLVLPTVVTAWALANIISIIVSTENRALHDYIAGTVVINTRYMRVS